MLLLYGKSGAGKTSFIRNFFPPNLFPQVNISMNKQSFQDNSTYDAKTVLWTLPEINSDLSMKNLFFLQNLIDSDTTLNMKY